MQMDFHFGVTYILARLSGFSQNDSYKVAYSAQYVDDAIYDKSVLFDNGAIFKPLCSAHKALDYRNFDKLSDHFVWIPFHFLPGNFLLKENEKKNYKFYELVKCLPNSYLAKDMVNECIKSNKNKESLYRLGITMHVYADTWAHQKFSGIQHYSNKVTYLEDDDVSKNLLNKVSNYFKDIFDKKISKIVDEVKPIGHGSVLSYPDRPYLKWSYKDFEGKHIKRDNALIYLEAVEYMYKALQRFKKGDPLANVSKLDKDIKNKFLKYFRMFTESNGEKRLEKWIKLIENGTFGFKDKSVFYDSIGKESWMFKALKGNIDYEGKLIKYYEEFFDSDWKKFHDALYKHRHFVLSDILPKYKLLIV
jgi:hypothetical protein